MELLTVPNELLARKCEPVKKIDDGIVSLAELLLASLEPLKAVGLSACQLGFLKSVAVIRYTGVQLVMINPEILKRGKMVFVEERCISIPGKVFTVKRPKFVKVSYVGLDGKTHTFRGRDLLAQAICHEIDHLNGITIDKIGRLREV